MPVSSSPNAETSAQGRIRDAVVPMLRPYASRIELFGSEARGDSTPSSDIDILVTLRPPEHRPPLGLRWFELEQELSDQLGRSVELVTERALSPHLRSHVAADRLTLYEDE